MNRRFFLIPFCFLLLVCSLLAFLPGSYSIDSWNHYGQMISGNYTDWHSPLMPFTWKWLSKISGQFSAMYLFQMVLYWLFFYYLWRQVKSTWIFLLTFILSIFFLYIPQYVMKDVHVALPWGLVFVLLLYSHEQKREGYKWLIFILLVYGLWMRVNTVFAILPAIYLFTEIYLLKKAVLWKKIAVSLIIAVFSVAGYFIFTYSILNARHEYPEYKLMLQDVVGISKASGKDYMPLCVSQSPDYRKDTIYKLYHPASFDDIFWPASGKNVPDPNPEIMKCLSTSWKQAILAEPAIYLKNRGEGFLYYLRLKKRFKSNEYWNYAFYTDPNNPIGLVREGNKAVDKILNVWGRLNASFLFAPWFWLLGNIIFFVLFLWHFLKRKLYQDKILFYVQLSAILFTLCQFPVYQHDRDFRYNYYNVIVLVIGIAFSLRPAKEAKTTI